MFPVEIWEIIIKEIDDPITLTGLQRVCRLWRHLIERIIRNHPKWRTLCIESVPSWWRNRLIGRYFPSAYESSDGWYSEIPTIGMGIVPANLWRKIYTSWMNFQLRVKLPRAIDQDRVNELLKFSASESITCINIDWGTVVFATTEGFIYFCDHNDLKKPFFVAYHGHPVAAKVTLCCRCAFIAVSTRSDGHLKYWDFLKRREIQSTEDFGRFVQGSDGYGKNGSFAAGLCYSVWNGCLSHYGYKNESISCLYEFQLLPLETRKEIVALDAYNEYVLILNNEDNSTTMYQLTNNMSSHALPDDLALPQISRRLPDDFSACQLKKFEIFSEDVTVCLTDRWLAFSVRNGPWIPYKIHTLLGGNVKCVDIRGFRDTFLFMGLDTGEVCVFSTRREIDLRNFNFRANAMIDRLRFGTDPINSVSHYGTNIFACSKKHIYKHEYLLPEWSWSIHESDLDDSDD